MGKLAEIKTKENAASVADFINAIAENQKRTDCQTILVMMEEATGELPKMWGNAMVGFGNVRYKSPATGREVEWFKIGFAPRKSSLSLHLMNLQPHADLLTKLGKHKTGAGCLYINKLEDVDAAILKNIIDAAAK